MKNKRQYHLHLSEKDYARLTVLAAKKELSFAQLIREYLRQEVPDVSQDDLDKVTTPPLLEGQSSS